MSGETGAPGGGAPPEPPGKPDRQWLGENLRALLKRYADEPLPDEFRALLDRLETENANSASKVESDDGAGEGGLP